MARLRCLALAALPVLVAAALSSPSPAAAAYGCEERAAEAQERHAALVAWLASLGSLFAGVAWRPESALADAAWASGPVAAHSVFFISAVLALNLEPAESADEGRKAD